MTTPVALKDKFASNYATWGLNYQSNAFIDQPTNYDPLGYYEPHVCAWKMYGFYDSIGDTTNRDLCPTLAARGKAACLWYINNSLNWQGNPGAVAAWRMFSEGWYIDYLHTGDQADKTALADLRDYAPFTNPNDPYLVSYVASRETVYRLAIYYYNWLIGNDTSPNTTAMNTLINLAIGTGGHFDQWQGIVPTSDGSHLFVRPFMAALSTKLIMRVHESSLGPVNNFITRMVSFWDWLWANYWGASNIYGDLSFHYTSVDTAAAPFTAATDPQGYNTGGTEPSEDLNLLIAPVMAYLFYKTGDSKWRTRFDTMWASGISRYGTTVQDPSWQGGAFLGSQTPDTTNYPGDTMNSAGRRSVKGKSVDQCYWWSTEGIQWAEGTPIISPTPPSGGRSRTRSFFFHSRGGTTNYVISGKVSTSGGTAVDSVTITGSGVPSGSTDSQGNYAITGTVGASYTITPTKTGYTFSPTSATGTLNTNATANFTATAAVAGFNAANAAYTGLTLKAWHSSRYPTTLTLGGAAASNGGNIDTVTDKSSSGWNLTQATSTLQPTRVSGITNGAKTFDVIRYAAGSKLIFPSAAEAFAQGVAGACFFVTHKITLGSVTAHYLEFENHAGTDYRCRCGFLSDGQWYIHGVRADGETGAEAYSGAGAKITTDVYGVSCFVWDYTNNQMSVYHNNVSKIAATTISTAGSTSATASLETPTLGCGLYSGTNAKDIIDAVLYLGVPSAAVRQQIQTDMAAEVGVTA